MDTLFAHCSAAFAQHGPLLASFFMAGLTGGFTHCVAMCGPLVASQSMACGSRCAAACSGRKAAARDLSSLGQLPYHLGRATAYGALGFFSALLSRQIASSAHWHWISAAMLAIAGVLFVVSSLPNCHIRPVWGKVTGLGYLRGVLLGFMPCGMLYAAVMMAATLADPLAAMLAMWVFVLGTLPALMLMSASAGILARRWQHAMQRLGRAMMAFNGLSLLVMAGNLMR